MSERTPVPTWDTEATVANIVAEPAFHDLVNFAAEVCLQAPARVQRHKAALEYTPGEYSSLVGQLGMWGVRTALDLADHEIYFQQLPAERKADVIYADTPIQFPRSFSGRPNIGVQRTIEAFGKSMLDEAFICLGDGALEKAHELRASYDEYEGVYTEYGPEVEQSAQAFNWLLKRIKSIMSKENIPGSGPETEESPFYHPTRLSPKFIGQYPDIGVQPTCLGVSILTAAFAEKAGLKYFHAGVAESSQDFNQRMYSYSLGDSFKHAKSLGIMIPDSVSQTINEIKAENDEGRYANRGYHAAIVVEILPGAWLQVDPNYGVNILLEPEDSEKLNNTYAMLSKFAEQSPGLEIMQNEPPDSLCTIFEYLYRKRRRAAKQPNEIESWLLNRENITFDALANTFINHYYFGRTKSAITQSLQECIRETLSDVQLSKDNESILEEEYLSYRMVEVIQKYVFPDAKTTQAGLEKAIARCRSDSRYLARRVEDLRLAPLLFNLMTTPDFLDDKLLPEGTGQMHARLELGLPAYRIGACVLSDFAVYCGDELPASFWLTYWPSHVAATEHASKGRLADQPPMLQNILGNLKSSYLRYTNSYGIIDWYLEQPTKESDAS